MRYTRHSHNLAQLYDLLTYEALCIQFKSSAFKYLDFKLSLSFNFTKNITDFFV